MSLSTTSFVTKDKRVVTTPFSTATSGLVPAPTSAANTNEYYLSGNATWVELNTTLGGLINNVELASSASNDDVLITTRNGSTYTLNLSDYGYEGTDDEGDDLTVGGTVTTYTYNESTYSYRIGQVGKDINGDYVDIPVVNNSTFDKFDPEDEEVAYNDTDNYCQVIN